MKYRAAIIAAVGLLTTQSALAHGWQAAAMWDWAINTANPRFDDLQSQIDTLQVQINNMGVALAAVESNSVLDLDGILVAGSHNNLPVARFQNTNVQIINGQSSTQSINGLGNLIIGYDLPSTTLGFFCSEGTYDNQYDCENAGYVWADSQKTGSHYLIVGSGNHYTQYGGIVAGQSNLSSAPYGSVIAGYHNRAIGLWSATIGGTVNQATGNTATVTGGRDNKATGSYASVSGGNFNTASGGYASILGGASNEATAGSAAVTGGYNNTASGGWSVVSGGLDRTASGSDDWVAGTLFEDE